MKVTGNSTKADATGRIEAQTGCREAGSRDKGARLRVEGDERVVSESGRRCGIGDLDSLQ